MRVLWAPAWSQHPDTQQLGHTGYAGQECGLRVPRGEPGVPQSVTCGSSRVLSPPPAAPQGRDSQTLLSAILPTAQAVTLPSCEGLWLELK